MTDARVCRPICPGVHHWGPIRLEALCPARVAFELVYRDFGEGEHCYPLCLAHAEEIARRWHLPEPVGEEKA